MNTSEFQKISEVNNHNDSGLSFNNVEQYCGIDYSSILLSHVIFPQYQMIDYPSDRNTDLSIKAKGYQFVRDPIFVLIDGHRIRYMIHVYQNNITSGIENLTNFIDEDETPTKSNKLLLSWIQHLPSNGLYIFEITLNNNLINIIDCYLFSNVFLGHQTYEWRLTIINNELMYHTNVIASKPYPDIDIEEKVLIAKKNNVVIRALQCNASQRFDYILGGNRYNIAPYKFAIIGCHIDKYNKCRYVVLGRHCGTLQVCSLIKLSSAKANIVNELTNIDEYPAIFKFGILSSQLSLKNSRRNFNEYDKESTNLTHKKKSIPDKARKLDVLMIHDFLEEQSVL
ncbi:hypothetical protein KQX54_012353 [Cotesia glomerata]|uniref:Uncharacterized protein n=1 Tax=Cotesia glomerata TaxID=32391 RepID=A0AAV7IJC3_COTGL|nr:hypothetical protein KQX54_012353 [Cotesia glomerata]